MSSPVNVQELTSLPVNHESKSILFFWASWHESSSPNGQMDIVFRHLAASSPSISFYRVEAEMFPKISSKFNVTVVPTFILLDDKGSIVERLEGTDPARLTQCVSALSSITASNSNTTGTNNIDDINSLEKRLKSLTHSQKVMLFMKGSPESPRCGFSRKTVEIFSSNNIPFGSFDILTDDEVRQGLKTYSDWPTYPQIYVNGELIGGLDILNEMVEEENLHEQLGVEVALSLDQRLKKSINQSRVMLFMKGLPSSPRCGFSRQIVDILEEAGCAFGSFDILTDEEVRQGLKAFSDWPTYPQLYVDGELIGGLDIVKEMIETGDFSDLISVHHDKE